MISATSKATSCEFAHRIFLAVSAHRSTTNNASQRSGLPKKAETFFFFEIDKNVAAFRTRLHKVVPLIASDKSVSSGREKIAAHRKGHSGFLSLAFANISFSSKGLQKVSSLTSQEFRIVSMVSAVGSQQADNSLLVIRSESMQPRQRTTALQPVCCLTRSPLVTPARESMASP